MSKPLIVKCPKCSKEIEYYSSDYRPFCSERCKLIDLGNWADGKYAVPTEDTPSEDHTYENPFQRKSSASTED